MAKATVELMEEAAESGLLKESFRK